jgi:hypothetical protein
LPRRHQASLRQVVDFIPHFGQFEAARVTGQVWATLRD